VAKPDFGTKRLCGNCAAKFYDLNKNPIVCPTCDTVFVVPVPRARPEPVRAVVPVAAAVPVEPKTPDVELVSLEDADAEAQGKKPAAGKADAETEDDVEIDESLDDAAFIEEEEDGDPDVTDIIGEAIEKEEET
jgi:uncharacterized protein (TIGR02300 family)